VYVNFTVNRFSGFCMITNKSVFITNITNCKIANEVLCTVPRKMHAYAY